MNHALAEYVAHHGVRVSVASYHDQGCGCPARHPKSADSPITYWDYELWIETMPDGRRRSLGRVFDFSEVTDGPWLPDQAELWQ